MTTLTTRPYAGDADLQAVCDLLNACDAVDQQDDSYTVEELRVEFSNPRVDQQNDLRVWEDDGRLVGFGQTWNELQDDPIEGFLYFRVLPEARGAGIEQAIVDWGAQRLRTLGSELGKSAALRAGTVEQDVERRGLLEHNGFSIDRYFFAMERALTEPIAEPQFPQGITLRHVASEADVAAWVEAFNLSFIDHWHFHEETVEERRHLLTDPNYAPEHDLIAVTENGTVAGFCFCMIHAEENARTGRSEGRIHLLGTRRGFRQIGLGRALLLAGMQRLRNDGMTTLRLGVDAANPSGALQFYENHGFKRVMTRLVYHKPLE